jgi:hypothetical protein
VAVDVHGFSYVYMDVAYGNQIGGQGRKLDCAGSGMRGARSLLAGIVY